MSRSIHANLHRLHEEMCRDYADPEVQRANLQALRADVGTKSEIKRLVRKHRRVGEGVMPLVPVESIPIHVYDEGPYVHYPAGPEDLRALLCRLPHGAADGLQGITLCLGKEEQDQEGDDNERDPLTGRRGAEALPAVYCGHTLGHFRDEPGHDTICIFAYVYDPSLPDREMWELVLRLWMLGTAMHELAHYHDYRHNRKRGHWTGYKRERNEAVARRLEATWVRDYAAPYLEAHYPAAVECLQAWLEQHGGIRLPLASLAGAWRWASPSRFVPLLLTVESAFRCLAEAVARGETRTATRLGFAEGIHWAEYDDEALEICARVLVKEPENAEALALQADIHDHHERYAEALRLALRAVECDPSCLEAWRVLAEVYEAQGAWQELLEAAERGLALASKPYLLRDLQVHRARAHLELERDVELGADLAALSAIRNGRALADPLRAICLLRRGHYAEALAIANDDTLRGYYSARRLLAAVRYDAAHALGRPQEAGEIDTQVLAFLRGHHYFAWADRLERECGLAAKR